MTERPILFSDAMVRAILDGRKTETRRVVKPRRDQWWLGTIGQWPNGEWFSEHGPPPGVLDATTMWPLANPYGSAGDLLYVREAHQFCDEQLGRIREQGAAVWYRAGDTVIDHEHHPPLRVPGGLSDNWVASRWRPSIHMPKWASRIWLRVVEVRIERLQEITPSMCIAEGLRVPPTTSPAGHPCLDGNGYRAAFADLWDGINAGRGYAWATDPWVWVVRFEVVSTTGKPANV